MSHSTSRTDFKRCFVPVCPNNTMDCPNKIFIRVPRLLNSSSRLKWFKSVGIINSTNSDSNIFCCEDHFNLESDAVNFHAFKIMGKSLIIRPDVFPHLNLTERETTDESQLSESDRKHEDEFIMDLKRNKPTTSRKRSKSYEDHCRKQTKTTSIKCKVFAMDDYILSKSKQISINPVNIDCVEKIERNPVCLENENIIEDLNVISAPFIGRDSYDVSKSIPILSNIKLEFDEDEMNVQLQEETDRLLVFVKKEKTTFLYTKEENRIYPSALVNTNGSPSEVSISSPLLTSVKLEYNEEEVNGQLQDAAESMFVPEQIMHLMQLNQDIQLSEPHQCEICQKALSTALDLIAHRYTHTFDNYFSCCTCFRIYANKRTMEMHITRKHSTNIKNHSINLLDTDENLISPNAECECNICHVSFDKFSSLTRHNRIHTSKKWFECEICHIACPSRGTLNNHIVSHAKEKSYKCNICHKQYKRKSHLVGHKLIHTGEKPYVCNICLKPFRRSGALSRHRLIHTGRKPHECDICHLAFTQMGHLNIHKRTHTGEKPYQCVICHKTFTSTNLLTRHTRTHTGERPFACNICQATFTHRPSLTLHKLMHSGEKPYECTICQKAFMQRHHLSRHKRVHTGEKPYECDVCQLAFTQRGHLNMHKRIHTGEKPYECDLCEKAFLQRSLLTRHMRIHTGRKPYQCGICNKTFAQVSLLDSHKSRVHLDKILL